MKLVVNRCYGGFELSKEAVEYLGFKWDGHGYLFKLGMNRDDPRLVKCVEELGTDVASGKCAKLVVVEIPDGINYGVEEYDGVETVVNEDYRDLYYVKEL